MAPSDKELARTASRESTRERLVRAAATAFADSGLEGSTTREIARLAGVNEVTLFRHFQNKEGLLAAVVEHTFKEPKEVAPSPSAKKTAGSAGDDLRVMLRVHARIYHNLLSDHFPLIRALIGEIHRHQEQEKQVIKALFVQRRQELLRCLKLAVDQGLVRKDVDLAILADQFGGMIFFNVLKRSSDSSAMNYSSDQYLEASIDILARGIEVTASERTGTKRKPKRKG